MFCKTIILSNSENISSNAPKGILTLSNDQGITSGKIRLYNMSSLSPETKIGLYINEKVHISKLLKRPYHYEFAFDEKLDLNQSIYCALIDNSLGDKKVVLEGGSFNGFYFTDSPFDAVLEAKDEELEKEIDEALKKDSSCENCLSCENCEYKKYFYENYNDSRPQSSPQPIEKVDDIKQDLDLKIDDLIEENALNIELEPNTVNPPQEENFVLNKAFDNGEKTTQNKTDVIQPPLNTLSADTSVSKKENNPLSEENTIIEQEEFLQDIIYQLDEMFKIYPADEILNSIIPNSKFIKVNTDSANYVLGVIYEDNLMKYIAYGVPAQHNSLPPNDLGKNYQWLPLNPNDVMSDGYFMIYQNALTGQIVELILQ